MASHERDHAQHRQAQQTEKNDFSHSTHDSTSAHVLRQMNGARFRVLTFTDLKSSQLRQDNRVGFKWTSVMECPTPTPSARQYPRCCPASRLNRRTIGDLSWINRHPYSIQVIVRASWAACFIRPH